MANRFGLTYTDKTSDTPLSPRIYAILNNTYTTENNMPLLGESVIHQQEKQRAVQRKREREEKELKTAEKKAKAEA